MKDLHSKVKVISALDPAVVAGTTTSATIDLQGFNSALFIVNTGKIAEAGNYTVSLTESANDNSGFSTVANGDLIGTFPAALEEDSIFKIGYKGAKRYLRVVTTKNSGTSIATGIVAVLGNPADAPVA